MMEWRTRNPRSFVLLVTTFLFLTASQRSGTVMQHTEVTPKQNVPVGLVIFPTRCHEASIQNWILHQIFFLPCSYSNNDSKSAGDHGCEGSAYQEKLGIHSQHPCVQGLCWAFKEKPKRQNLCPVVKELSMGETKHTAYKIAWSSNSKCQRLWSKLIPKGRRGHFLRRQRTGFIKQMSFRKAFP